MNNLKQYQKELQEKYNKLQKPFKNVQKEVINKIARKYKIKKKIVVLDSENRNKDENINEFTLRLLEEYRNVYAVRLLKSEYTLKDAEFDRILINSQPIAFQIYKPVHAFLYLNGYKQIDIASISTTELFSQLSPGIEQLPLISDNIKLDPYVHILNPIEKRLNKFNIKILDNKGDKIPVENPDKIRLILTLLIVTLE